MTLTEQKFRLIGDSPYVAPSEAHPDPWKLVDEYRQAAKLAKVSPSAWRLLLGFSLTSLFYRLPDSMVLRSTRPTATSKSSSWTSTATTEPTSGEETCREGPSSSRRRSRLSSRPTLPVELASRSTLAEVRSTALSSTFTETDFSPSAQAITTSE